MEQRSITNIDADNFRRYMEACRFYRLNYEEDFKKLKIETCFYIFEESVNGQKASWEQIFNIKSDVFLIFSDDIALRHFLELFSDNIRQIRVSDYFMEKMLDSRSRYYCTHVSTVPFVMGIVYSFRWHNRTLNAAQRFIESLLDILKLENRFQQIRLFVLRLAEAIKHDMSTQTKHMNDYRVKIENGEDRQTCEGQIKIHRECYEADKEVVRFILKALKDRNMGEYKELLIDNLDSAIKIEMEDLFQQYDHQNIEPDEPHEGNNLSATSCIQSNHLETTDICSLLEQGYKYACVHGYSHTLYWLAKSKDLLDAIRESGHFCYYACMLSTKEYESVKQNFSSFERFKVYLYRSLLWHFFKPEIDAQSMIAYNKNPHNIADSTKTIIEEGHPKLDKISQIEKS